MQLQIFEEDVDVHRHFETRQKDWIVERRHLANQLNREREVVQARKAAAAAEAARRKQKLTAAWKGEDAVLEAYRMEQVSIAQQEQNTRQANDANRAAAAELRRKEHTDLILSSRDSVESRERAADDLAEKVGQAHWKFGMQRGAREFALERAEGGAARTAAVRGFQ